MRVERIQQALQERGIDGWLFYDFHHRDPLAYRILGLPSDSLVSRRWYYLVPAQGEPAKLVHRIESGQLDSLPGKTLLYAGWRELLQRLEQMLAAVRSVAMQYSPNNQIPSVSLVDAGTVELVRSFGKQVVSSADLVQRFEACWSEEALASHLEAGKIIDRVIPAAFVEIGRRVGQSGQTDEYAIQRFLMDQFAQNRLTTDSPPIVAVNGNSGNPHYQPSRTASCPIREGDFVLLDVWGKCDRPGAVYYDVTWTGFLGAHIPEPIGRIFEIVKRARDAAFHTVQEAISERRKLQGWEVDRAARGVIEASGHGDHFVHRTGHSIGEEVHGNGANMDDLETHEEREIIPRTAFSIEPGIYLPEFGVRSEVNVFVDDNSAHITGPVQDAVVMIPSRN